MEVSIPRKFILVAPVVAVWLLTVRAGRGFSSREGDWLSARAELGLPGGEDIFLLDPADELSCKVVFFCLTELNIGAHDGVL